jgi:hypothetical protein
MSNPSKISFRQAIFRLLAEGQVLSGAEKYLVNQEINKFVREYRAATGEEASALFGPINLMAPRLEMLGFRLPTIQRWIKDEMEAVNAILEKRGGRRIEHE